MQMTGEQQLAAPRQQVWQALNDPEVLRNSIPGCQSLSKDSDTQFSAVVEVKVGPIGARFKGHVTLTDIHPAEGYTLNLEGNGGIAGSAKGSAKVTLEDANGGTLLRYEVNAEVGGRMAQLGGPLIDATAKQLAGAFFNRFADVMLGGSDQAASGNTGTAANSTVAASSAGTPVYASAPAGGGFWKSVALGLIMLLVAFAAFEYGKNNAAPQVIVLDKSALEELLQQTPADRVETLSTQPSNTEATAQ